MLIELFTVHLVNRDFAGTGCHVWTSGLVLAEWLVLHPELVEGKTVLEIGSGLVCALLPLLLGNRVRYLLDVCCLRL